MSIKPWDIYAEQLFRELPLYGRPLWVPQPRSASDPDILLGDVGYLHNGQFVPLFNTMKASVNKDGAPIDIGSVPVKPEHAKPIQTAYVIKSDSPPPRKMSIIEQTGSATLIWGGHLDSVTNASSQPHCFTDPGWPVPGRDFRCGPGPGAFIAIVNSLVTTPQIHSTKWIRRCIQDNMDSWLEFVKADELEHGRLADKDIVFVYKLFKAGPCWALGASTDGGLGGEDDPACQSLTSSQYGGPRVSQDHSFPVCYSNVGLMDASPDALQQCLFIDYYKAKRCTSEHKIEPKDRIRNEGGYDPIGPLLDYILQHSKAAIAMASTQDLRELFMDSKIPDSKQILREIELLSPMIQVDERGIGTIDCTARNIVNRFLRRWIQKYRQRWGPQA